MEQIWQQEKKDTRKVNMDRYDDRESVRTNLIDSFDQLMDFARKHLPDKFFLEDENRVSLRNIIVRDMIGNTLMHREFTSLYAAKFVIQKDKMYTENASRALKDGFITPDNLEPNPKNPLIASFFRNIGRADRLGSGVLKLYKYSKLYSGKDPMFQEGDVFRIFVPLDEEYSFDYRLGDWTTQSIKGQKENQNIRLTDKDMKLLKLLEEMPKASQSEIAAEIGWDVNTVKYYTAKLKKMGILGRKGSTRKGSWIVKKPYEDVK